MLLMFTFLIIACSTDPAPAVAEPTAVAPEETPAFTWYGEEPPTEVLESTISVEDLLKDPAGYQDETVLVAGRVTEVCQKKGCWMVIAHDDLTMRVMMKDHAFSVDMNGAGNDCMVHGTVITKPVDPEFVEHLASESVNVDKMPEAGKEAGTVLYQLEATGVRM